MLLQRDVYLSTYQDEVPFAFDIACDISSNQGGCVFDKQVGSTRRPDNQSSYRTRCDGVHTDKNPNGYTA